MAIQYVIEQDEINASYKLDGCITITDVRKRLQEVYNGEEWWIHEGGTHVRMHQVYQRNIIQKFLGLKKPHAVFFAIDPTGDQR